MMHLTPDEVIRTAFTIFTTLNASLGRSMDRFDVSMGSVLTAMFSPLARLLICGWNSRNHLISILEESESIDIWLH